LSSQDKGFGHALFQKKGGLTDGQTALGIA